MSKLRFLFLALLGLMGGYLLGGILHAEGFPLTGNSLTNGDFETGTPQIESADQAVNAAADDHDVFRHDELL